jgi:tRNA-dihydrouridine synthase
MSNIWNTLPYGFSVLAPMEDVTDTVFRRVIAQASRSDLFFTEFTNVEGMQSEYGRPKVIHRLKFTEIEAPIIAQVWGKTPEDYFKTAEIIANLGFDGLDINMGCPVKKVIALGCCSALINNHEKAKEIIDATRRGLKSKIPLSVKTRIGMKTIDTENWFNFLLDQNLDAITIHARTVKEESKVPNHWEEIAKVMALRDNKKSMRMTEYQAMSEMQKVAKLNIICTNNFSTL